MAPRKPAQSMAAYAIPFLTLMVAGWFGLASLVQSKRDLRVRRLREPHTAPACPLCVIAAEGPNTPQHAARSTTHAATPTGVRHPLARCRAACGTVRALWEPPVGSPRCSLAPSILGAPLGAPLHVGSPPPLGARSLGAPRWEPAHFLCAHGLFR
jgi:hypothetical protein